jgi:hypothetical protein
MRTPLRVAAVAALILALAGCTAGGGSDSSGTPGVAGGGSTSGSSSSGGSSADAGAKSTIVQNRAVVVTGSLAMVAEDPLGTADRAQAVVEQAGGRLDGITKEPKSEFKEASAQLIARIPTERLDATLKAVERLGTVQSLSTSTNDVTQQTTDLGARVASLQASVDRLRKLLSSAASTADLITIEKALSDREADLEGLTAQRDYLADQVHYATITIGFSTPATAPGAAPKDFWGAVAAGFAGLVSALVWAGIALGVALPWLVFAGLLTILVLLVLRLLRRGRRRKPIVHGPSPAA